MSDQQAKRQTLDELKRRVADLEAELRGTPQETWERAQSEFYPTYLAWSGAVLGMFGAIASLLVNVIGSLAVGQHPLRLIQVYLTFPLGEKALGEGLDTGIVMALGCCLYILTGMVLGIPLQLLMARFIPHAGLGQRLVFGTIAGLLLWAVNFYLLLAWIQPLLFGGRWITDLVPPWIGAGTHLVFAWVVAALYPWGTLAVQRQFPASEAEGESADRQ